MYNFLAVSPGSVKLIGQPLVRLTGGDVISVQAGEAEQVKNSCASFLRLVSFDPEPESQDGLTELTLGQKLQLNAAAKTTSLPVKPEHAEDDLIKLNQEVHIDLSLQAKAPEAMAYLKVLIELDPPPIAKIKAVAKRYPLNTRIQDALQEVIKQHEGTLEKEALENGTSDI